MMVSRLLWTIVNYCGLLYKQKQEEVSAHGGREVQTQPFGHHDQFAEILIIGLAFILYWSTISLMMV